MKKIFILLVTITSNLFYSQTDSAGPFIKFKTGIILYGAKVVYEPELFNSKVRLDGSPYKSSELSFFRDEKGIVFGNLNGFTENIGNSKGVYFFCTTSTSQTTQNYTGSSYSKTTTSKKSKYFYSEGFTEMKRVNFPNFQFKMQDDSISKYLMYKAGRARGVCLISTGIFATTILANFLLLGNPAYTESNALFVVGGVALGSLVTAIVYNRIKLKRTQNAINKYYGVYVPIGE